jgi:hypothetical protein
MSTLTLPKAYSRFGASMGRYSTPDYELPKGPVKVSLQQIPLDSGGYDSGGAYWGTGETLWRASDDISAPLGTDYFQFWLRAPSREAAKRAVLAKLPGARFYR